MVNTYNNVKNKHYLSQMTCEGVESILRLFFLLWSFWMSFKKCHIFAERLRGRCLSVDSMEELLIDELYCLLLCIVHSHPSSGNAFSSSRPERATHSSCLFVHECSLYRLCLFSSGFSVNVDFYISLWTFYQIFQGDLENMELFIQELSTVMWASLVHKCYKHFRDAST